GKDGLVPAWRLLGLTGEPGVARRLDSPLVDRERELDLLRGAFERTAVLRARCLAYGEGITFWPVAEVVRKAAAIDEADPPEAARAKIAALVPDGAVADGVAAAIGLAEGGAELQEIFWAIRKLLEALAAKRPVLCVFDDVHWAEATFLDLVEHVAGR